MKEQISMQDFVSIINNHLLDSEISIIFEIGSMDGKDSLYLKEYFKNASIFAIEGLPENYEKYLKKINNIVSLNRVISSYDGESFYFKKNINGLHGIYDRGQEYGSDKLFLKCCRIDTLCNELKIDVIDVAKIDVEGATYDVLVGFGDLLKKVKIIHIETESFPFFKGQKLHADVCDFLTKEGFIKIKQSKCEIIKDQFQYDSVWINSLYFKRKDS